MSNVAHQSPLGVNALGALLSTTGLTINPVTQGYMGTSTSNTSYSPGSLVNDTVLKPLTYAIQEAYTGGNVSSTVYDKLISIGVSPDVTIPALGNSKPTTFDYTDSPGWGGNNYNSTNAVTQWGMIRLFALQAYQELNFNLGYSTNNNYSDFLTSWEQISGYINYMNSVILSAVNSRRYMSGTYSNMDDIISGDITGVSIASQVFGKDLIQLGRAIDLATISTFGLPSNLLITIDKNKGLTSSLATALLAAGISSSTLNQIVTKKLTPTKQQEKSIYQAFDVIRNDDLNEILVSLNCQTPYLVSLVDLLNPQKLFPNSYTTLTVPVYNGNQVVPSNATGQTVGNTNIPSFPPSKIYYPIYGQGSITSAVTLPTVNNYISPSLSTTGPQYQIYNNRITNQIVNPYDSTSQITNSSINPTNLNTFYTGLAAGENIPLTNPTTINPSTNRNVQANGSLPQSTIKLLLKEAAAYYGFDINTVSIVSGSRQAPAGLSSAIQMPNGSTIDITDKMVQLARLKGFINANGQSTLPTNNINTTVQQLTSQRIALLTTEINDKLNGTRPLGNGETFNSLIQFARSNNIPINPNATIPASPASNIVTNSAQNNSGVSSNTFNGPIAPIRVSNTPSKN